MGNVVLEKHRHKHRAQWRPQVVAGAPTTDCDIPPLGRLLTPNKSLKSLSCGAVGGLERGDVAGLGRGDVAGLGRGDVAGLGRGDVTMCLLFISMHGLQVCLRSIISN